MLHHDKATERATDLLLDRASGPRSRLDAFLLLVSQQYLWRGTGPGADFAEAVRRYEAATGQALPRAASPPSFGVVKWRRDERRSEVAVWLAGRFLGWLASPSRDCADAGDWRAEERLLAGIGVARETARIEPARALLDTELRVIELARVHVVEPGASA